jgi:hypothetical protein
VRDELIGVSKRLGDVRFDNYDGDDNDDNNDNNNTNQLVGGSRSEDLVRDERKLEDRLGSSIEGYDERMELA